MTDRPAASKVNGRSQAKATSTARTTGKGPQVKNTLRGDRDDDGNSTDDSNEDGSDNDNKLNASEKLSTVRIRKLKGTDALPDWIRNDEQDKWTNIILPAWFAFNGASPHPFTCTPAFGVPALKMIFADCYGPEQSDEGIRYGGAIWHNVSNLIFSLAYMRVSFCR